MFFNIAQESLNNALKYAEAQHIWVRCKTDGTHLSMTIQDDGKGFDVEKSKETARKRGSFGLFNISDRARLVGGEAQVLSKIGKGSFVRVIAPVQHAVHTNGQNEVGV
jgi:signal transduction histidine kinase